MVVRNNPDVMQASNFAEKSEQQRQINRPKKQEFAKNAKQAENFADKTQMLRPKKSHLHYWLKKMRYL